MDWLNYHHLYYFWLVAREGSIARAAKQLHLAHPTISKQLHQLEASFEGKLFERVGRNLVLTQFGQTVFRYAEEIFSEVRECLPENKLKVLVNNAAVQILGPSQTLSRADWHKTLDTNLLAPFFWVQALLGELAAANGSVVNISSIHAHQTKQNFLA